MTISKLKVQICLRSIRPFLSQISPSKFVVDTQAARNKAIGAAALSAAGQKPKMAPGSNPNSPGVGAQSPAGGGGGSSGKRPSRTPIIIIPAAPKSMITMYNAKDILQVRQVLVKGLIPLYY